MEVKNPDAVVLLFKAWMLANILIVVFAIWLARRQKKIFHLLTDKPMRLVTTPMFILHGGEILTDTGWFPIGPNRLAELYGLKKGTWMASNDRIRMPEQSKFYGEHCIHLCPLVDGSYNHHLAMRIAAYNDGDNELCMQMFYQHYNATKFHSYLSLKYPVVKP